MEETSYTRGRLWFKREDLPLDENLPLVEDPFGGLVPDIPEGAQTERKLIEYEGYPDPDLPGLWVQVELEVVDGRLVMHDYTEKMTGNTATERRLRTVSPDKIEGAIRRWVAEHAGPWIADDGGRALLDLSDWLPVDTKERHAAGRPRRDEIEVARFAEEWDALIEAGERTPRKTISNRRKWALQTTDDWRSRAVDLGYLSRPPGRGIAGGRMTELCREVLDRAS